MTLEVQHCFHGEVALFERSTDAEWYAYSRRLARLCRRMLAIGLWRDEWLRRAGCSASALVIAKVFLSDMAELGRRVARALLLGLGGALVGLGYAYRRLHPAPGSPSQHFAA